MKSIIVVLMVNCDIGSECDPMHRLEDWINSYSNTTSIVFGQCQGVSINTLTLAYTHVYYSNAVEVGEGN